MMILIKQGFLLEPITKAFKNKKLERSTKFEKMLLCDWLMSIFLKYTVKVQPWMLGRNLYIFNEYLKHRDKLMYEQVIFGSEIILIKYF